MAYPPVSHHVERPSHLSILTDPIKFQRVKTSSLGSPPLNPFSPPYPIEEKGYLAHYFYLSSPCGRGLRGGGFSYIRRKIQKP